MRLKHPLMRRIALPVLGTLVLPFLLIVLASFNYVEQESSLLEQNFFEQKTTELRLKTARFLTLQRQIEKTLLVKVEELAKKPEFTSSMKGDMATETLKGVETEVLNEIKLPYEGIVHLNYYHWDPSKQRNPQELRTSVSSIGDEFEKVLLAQINHPDRKILNLDGTTSIKKTGFFAVKLKGSNYRIALQPNHQAAGMGFFLALLKIHPL